MACKGTDRPDDLPCYQCSFFWPLDFFIPISLQVRPGSARAQAVFSHSLEFKLYLSYPVVSGTLAVPFIRDLQYCQEIFPGGIRTSCPAHFVLPPILSGFRWLSFLRVNPYLLLIRILAILRQVSSAQLCVLQTLD